jgi:hypothetical protein
MTVFDQNNFPITIFFKFFRNNSCFRSGLDPKSVFRLDPDPDSVKYPDPDSVNYLDPDSVNTVAKH